MNLKSLFYFPVLVSDSVKENLLELEGEDFRGILLFFTQFGKIETYAKPRVFPFNSVQCQNLLNDWLLRDDDLDRITQVGVFFRVLGQ